MSTLYEYAVLYQTKRGYNTKLVVPVTQVVADDEATVRLIAARAIPKGTDLGRCEVLVRPFCW